MPKIRTKTLHAMKQRNEKIACLTAYDASFAHHIAANGVDVILAGDSLGNVIQGRDTTVAVTVDDIAYHTENVCRAKPDALIISDMPFMSYYDENSAMQMATILMQAGAEMVKLEGGQWLVPTIKALTTRGIPVCGHLGLTPQSVHKLGGYKTQGRTQQQAQTLIENAVAIQDAGADLLVLECIPGKLAAEITLMLSIPTIGIGAGPECDGQILVIYDILGLTPGYVPKMAYNFLKESADIPEAIKNYAASVKDGTFPGPQQAMD